MIRPGDLIGRYEVQRQLGRGGMGTVYLAHDPILGRLVAIKLVLGHLDDSDARERFTREARSAGVLNHPNIVTVHDFGEFSSQPYIVMEYVVGESLATTIRRRSPVSHLEKLRWMEELCDGVAYAHEIGVLHRDIKPTNLMIDRSARLKIVDFGVARMLGTLGTNGEGLVGTPGYMAPEQILGGAVDPRCDLFSIGAVCYELLTYTEAFAGETVPAITHRVLYEQPTSLAELVPGIDPDLAAVIERALEKSVEHRFPDAAEMRESLTSVRRRLERYGGSNALAVSAEVAAGVVVGRRSSSGPGRPRTSSGGVKQMTPPPTESAAPSGVVERIQVALRRSRSLLEAGDLDLALDACEQALVLDEANPETLEVEGAIRAAATRRRARGLLADGRAFLQQGALEDAQTRLEQARGLNTEIAECARLDSDLRAARVERERAANTATGTATIVAGPILLDLGEFGGGATVISPPLATPRPAPGRRESQVTHRGPQSFTPPPVAPRPTAPPGERRPTTRSAGLFAQGRRRLAALAGVAAALLAAVALGMWLLERTAATPTGAVAIDAVPWGTVTEIRTGSGKPQALPSDPATPLVLILAAGTYDVTISGPGGHDSRSVKVQVAAAGFSLAPVPRFPTVTVEDYFEQYLSFTPSEPAPSERGSPIPDDLPIAGSQ